jgi:RNA polymerase sigma-70 factor (ECF subfamily)
VTEIRAEDDATLVRRLRAQERGAFDELYALHHERIWAFLVRLCGRRDDAEDLFQETWVKAARHVHRLEEGSRLLPWLFTIARNEHRSARRFLLFDFRKREQLLVEPLEGSRDPEDLLLDREEALVLEAALAAVGDAHREVLLLAHVEGLPSADIAKILGQSDDAVRKRLSRARAELRAAVEEAERAPRRPPQPAPLAEDDEARDPS